MEVKQIYELVNAANIATMGANATVLLEDLSNLVDIGNAIFDAEARDPYTKALINQIGRMVFDDRVYTGSAPNIKREAWEYGSILAKVHADMPEASENETWELVNGASYDPNVFHAPSVHERFWNQMTTFEVDISVTDRQLKQSFASPQQMNAFVSMLYTKVKNRLTICMDNLIMRTIDNFIGETLYDEYQGSGYTTKSGSRAVNLYKLYKDDHPDSKLTAKTCLKDYDFLLYATAEIGKYRTFMKNACRVFNVGETEKFTPESENHVVLLSHFVKDVDSIMRSATWHKELVELPRYDEVAYWQAPGQKFAYGDCSHVNVKTSSGNTVDVGSVLGVMFDHEAAAVSNQNSRVTSNYNPKAEFTNYFYKEDARYMNDLNENFVVFFVA